MKKTDLKHNLRIKKPKIDSTVFIAKGAQVIGDVVLNPYSSIWYNSVLRADINNIIIGSRSNIQDNCTLHLENNKGILVGDDVTIGHNVILHGCTIGDGALIGMGSIIMNGVKIGRGATIGAGALIIDNTTIPDYCVAVGAPVRVIKKQTEKAYIENVKWAQKYVELAKVHKDQI